jgi:T5SS/PEP-CTERM-associated repeat protein
MPNGYVYTWTGKSSTDFSTIGNWYNQTAGAPATAVPGVNDEALITSSGSITGTGNVYDLGLTGSGAGMTIAGQLAGSNLFAAGAVNVAAGGSLIFSNIIDIGDYQNGLIGNIAASVTIGAGGLLRGTLPITGDSDILVGRNGGTGTLTVTGQGALADAGARGFDVGDDGTGLIAVNAGGHITGGTGDSYQNGVSTQIGIALGDPGGSGTLIVSGAGAGATFGDLVDVGFGGTGVLTVASGGTLTAGDGAVALNIGDSQGNANGTGSVTFNAGTGLLNGFTEIGAYGSGTLALSSGASVTMTQTANTGDAAYWSALLGIVTGASGTLSIGSQSLLTTSHGLGIGVQGHGELDVSGTADISSLAGEIAIDAGTDAGGSGVITVAGGVLDDVSSTGMIFGGGGSGTLNVSAGGTVLCGGSAGFGGLILGDTSGSSGTASVSGAGATLTVAGQLQDGSAGTGVLSIGVGGAVTTGLSANELGLVIGADGGNGSASVAGGHLSVTGQIGVGIVSAGSMSMSAGGTVTATSSGLSAMEIGQLSGEAGTVTVTGAGTMLTLTGGLTDGGSGIGSFTISGGAHATLVSPAPNTLPGLTIAAFTGSGGSTMTIEGAGTVLSDTGQVIVGGDASGALTVSGGATLSVATGAGQTVPDLVIGTGGGTIASTATVTGSGSVLSVAGALIVGDTNHGTLQVLAGAHVTSNSLTVSSNSLSSGSLVVAGAGSLLNTDALAVGVARVRGAVSIDAGTVSVAGNASLHGALTLSDGGSLDATGIVQIAGNTTVSGVGTLSAAHIVDAGRIVVKGGVMTCVGVITGSGFLYAGGNANMIIDGRENASVGLHFGNNGTFTAASISELAGTITGWEARDALDFTGVKIASDSYAAGTLSLYDSSHHLLGREVFAGSYTVHNFALSADNGAGTLLTYHR